MRVPTISRFCFCIDLQTGNKVFCWIFLISYIAFILLALFSLIFGIDIVQVNQVDITKIVANNTVIEEEMQEVKKSKIGVADSIGTLIIASFLVVVCYFFLHGIKMHDTGKMMPYIIQNGVFGVLFVVASIYFMSIIFLIKSIIFLYIFIAAFSLYEVFTYEESQKQECVQMNANFKDFGHNYEVEGYGAQNIGDVEGATGMRYAGHVDEFHGP